jgi:hypothetical protein
MCVYVHNVQMVGVVLHLTYFIHISDLTDQFSIYLQLKILLCSGCMAGGTLALQNSCAVLLHFSFSFVECL